MISFTVELPVPPSINASYRNALIKGKMRRVKTDHYKKWRRASAFTIQSKIKYDGRIGGQVSVTIALPKDCRMDVDNVIKAFLDALVDSKRIDDDRHVMSVSSSKILSSGPAMVVVKSWVSSEAVAA